MYLILALLVSQGNFLDYSAPKNVLFNMVLPQINMGGIVKRQPKNVSFKKTNSNMKYSFLAGG